MYLSSIGNLTKALEHAVPFHTRTTQYEHSEEGGVEWPASDKGFVFTVDFVRSEVRTKGGDNKEKEELGKKALTLVYSTNIPYLV